MSGLAIKHERVTVSLDVIWKGSAGRKEDARMSEVSMGGCYIDSRVQGRALGDTVQFKVHLPDGPWVALQGDLIHEDYPMGFELSFRGLTEGDKRLLAKLIVAHGGVRREPQTSTVLDEEKTPAVVPKARRRVLVADDDSLTLRMLSAIVETEGYEVVSASDGGQALEFLQRDATFSAAIFDMMMPHFQGLGLIQYMKADERLRHIPVGMITAERDPKVWDDSVAAGACVFLPKPFTPPQVQMMLHMLASKAGNQS